MKRPEATTPRRRTQTVAWAALVSLAGCVAPMALPRAVLAYDQSITETQSKQLLINIARAQHHQPTHFTSVSSVTATYDFRVNAGATPALTGDASRSILPIFGGSVAESPTLSIVPIEGEEFTRRILTPIQERKLTLLLRQGVDVDLLLRLMAQDVRVEVNGEEVASRNDPADKAGYEVFRQVVLHLSTIQDHNKLYAEPITFERTWTLPADAITAEGFKALEEEYRVTYSAADKTFTLRKQITGRILITNYDPDSLTKEERVRLQDEVEQSPASDVAFDIRADHFGGNWPMHGVFRLRSLNSILNFIGRSIEQPEYHVEKDPRTPDVTENPDRTMDIVVGSSSPDESDLTVKSHGSYYSVNVTGPQARWNRESFKLLSQLFQMTVTDVTNVAAPGISIAK